jgi:hypothetical protein
MNPQNGLLAFLTSDQAIPIIAIVGGLMMAMTFSIVAGVRSIAVARAREQTRREIAAYVAEGSIDAEQAARLLEAEPAAGCDMESLIGACGSSRAVIAKGKPA